LGLFLNEYFFILNAKLHDLNEITKQFDTNYIIAALYFAIISEKLNKICMFEINSIPLHQLK